MPNARSRLKISPFTVQIFFFHFNIEIIEECTLCVEKGQRTCSKMPVKNMLLILKSQSNKAFVMSSKNPSNLFRLYKWQCTINPRNHPPK